MGKATKGVEAGGKGAKGVPLRGWAKVFGAPPDPQSMGRYASRPSPDRSLAVVFEPGVEIAMMRTTRQFRLVDSRRGVVEAFEGLSSPVTFAGWTPDSRIVAIPIDTGRGGLLVFDVARRRFLVVSFDPWLELLELGARGLRISPDPSQYFGFFPERKTLPDAIVVPFAGFDWVPAPESGPWKLRGTFRKARELAARGRRSR